MHRLLLRQLKKQGLSLTELPTQVEQWQQFLNKITKTYEESDNDRYLVNRSIDISSKELRSINEKLTNAQQIARLAYFHSDKDNVFFSKELFDLLKIEYQANPFTIDEFTEIFSAKNQKYITQHLKDFNQTKFDLECTISTPGLTKHWFRLLTKNEGPSAKLGVIFDINEKKLSEEKIKKRTNSLNQYISILKATLEASNDGILIVDLNDKVINCNQRFYDMWELPNPFDLPCPAEDVFDALQDKLQDLNTTFQRSNILNIDINHNFSGKIELMNSQLFVYDSKSYLINNKAAGRVWSFRDITTQNMMELRLEHQATHDPLTDLPNRALLYDRIEQAIAVCKRYERKFALLFIDIDGFKYVNDHLGHDIGDILLTKIAEVLEEVGREVDTLSRLGGDEFVLILTNIESINDIINATNRIIENLERPINLGAREVEIHASIGISYYPNDGQSAKSLLSAADLAMFSAKNKGGNRYEFYTQALADECSKRLEIERELKNALLNDEFFLMYQPQFDTEKKLIGLEALIRWQHPQKGLIMPNDFIQLAEECNLLPDIGLWVLNSAIKQCKDWQDNGESPIHVSVNVSTKQLTSPHFPKLVNDILLANKLPAHCLEIEVHENVIFDAPHVIETLNNLKRNGIKLSLDDFGTGNSSLTYFKHLDINHIKIDKSFVDHIGLNHKDEIIIKSIIAMAKLMSIEVIAEGVETEKQLDFLKCAECYGIQGYLFSRPLPVQAIPELLNRH